MTFATDNPIRPARVTFDDVDLFCEFVKELDWDTESTQLSTGPYELTFATIELPQLGVSRLTSRQSVYDRFSVPDGTVVFNITRAKLPAVWRGRHLAPNLMGVLRAGLEHWVTLPAGWDCYEITLAENLIRQSQLLPEDFFAKSKQLDRAYLPLMEPVTGNFIAQLDTIFAHTRDARAHDGNAVLSTRFLDFVMQGLLDIVDAGLEAEVTQKLNRARRPELVKQAINFVEANLDKNLSIGQLSTDLCVSARALNYAFRDNLGVNPYRYVLARKLHAVRRAVKSSDDPISEIIARYGFATPSRFGRQYLQLFGEHPSTTRNRR